jgi:ABC-type methionine transport system ATPase subunit
MLLSSGQRQYVSLRAYVSNPSIFNSDEATLRSPEELSQRATETITKGRTLLLLHNRLANDCKR